MSYMAFFNETLRLGVTMLLMVLSPGLKSLAQEGMDTSGIRSQLRAIYERDQKIRTGSDSAEFAGYIDSCNLVQVEALIARYGWMGKNVIGPENSVLFLVIQHADLSTQKKYYPLLVESVRKGESQPADAALMQDRMLMYQDKKQIYGSQVVFDDNGNPVFHPIEDEKNVNSRRASVGLEPIEEYAKFFGIVYKAPK